MWRYLGQGEGVSCCFILLYLCSGRGDILDGSIAFIKFLEVHEPKEPLFEGQEKNPYSFNKHSPNTM